MKIIKKKFEMIYVYMKLITVYNVINLIKKFVFNVSLIINLNLINVFMKRLIANMVVKFVIKILALNVIKILNQKMEIVIS